MDGDLARDLGRALTGLPGLALAADGATRIEAVFNHGGFVHRSFRVTSGRARYHVKLASAADDEELNELRRWWRLRDRLTRHGAPSLEAWVELESHGLAGPVLTWIEGQTPQALTGRLRATATEMVAALHADRHLADLLAREGCPVGDCRSAYRRSYHRRFVCDLAGIRAATPSFVTLELLEWMESEVQDLLRWVEGGSAFDSPANRATHRDLWLDNLIVEPGGALRIIDWDDVALGDPMMDWAMLFGPARGAFRIAERDDLRGVEVSASELERFALFARASLLDWVIDSLADWVEAPPTEHLAAVRDSKRLAHEEALRAYRRRPWAR